MSSPMDYQWKTISFKEFKNTQKWPYDVSQYKNYWSAIPLESRLGLRWVDWLLLSRSSTAFLGGNDLMVKERGNIETIQPGIVAGGKGQ